MQSKYAPKLYSHTHTPKNYANCAQHFNPVQVTLRHNKTLARYCTHTLTHTRTHALRPNPHSAEPSHTTAKRSCLSNVSRRSARRPTACQAPGAHDVRDVRARCSKPPLPHPIDFKPVVRARSSQAIPGKTTATTHTQHTLAPVQLQMKRSCAYLISNGHGQRSAFLTTMARGHLVTEWAGGRSGGWRRLARASLAHAVAATVASRRNSCNLFDRNRARLGCRIVFASCVFCLRSDARVLAHTRGGLWLAGAMACSVTMPFGSLAGPRGLANLHLFTNTTRCVRSFIHNSACSAAAIELEECECV